MMCSVGVVYKIPMSCGKVYVGQTGCCVDERLIGQKRNLQKPDKSSTLRHHSESCGSGCQPSLERTTVSLLHPDQFTPEVIEALETRSHIRGDCFSCLSVALTIIRSTTKEKQQISHNGNIVEPVIEVHGNDTE